MAGEPEDNEEPQRRSASSFNHDSAGGSRGLFKGDAGKGVELPRRTSQKQEGSGNQATADSRPSTSGGRIRTAVACNMCRKQKMKCEAPSDLLSPCRRCKLTNATCVFEQMPEGKMKEEVSIESRTLELERKLTLESQRSNALESRLRIVEAEVLQLRQQNNFQSQSLSYPPADYRPPSFVPYPDRAATRPASSSGPPSTTRLPSLRSSSFASPTWPYPLAGTSSSTLPGVPPLAPQLLQPLSPRPQAPSGFSHLLGPTDGWNNSRQARRSFDDILEAPPLFQDGPPPKNRRKS